MNEDQNTYLSEQEYANMLTELLAGFPLPPTEKPKGNFVSQFPTFFKASRSLSVSAEGKPRSRSNAAENAPQKSAHSSTDFRSIYFRFF